MLRELTTNSYTNFPVGKSIVGKYYEVPGALDLMFVKDKDLYGLTMIPLFWRDESNNRQIMSGTERDDLIKIFSTMASSIEFK